MTMHDRFEQFDGEYLEFDRIPEAERLHPNRTLCGYLKAASLLQDPAEFSVAAEHDIVYLAAGGELRELTDTDIVYLQRCGIHWDEECDCLADFC